VHRIPPQIALDDAAIIEPLACAIHAVSRGDIQLDDVTVIAGRVRSADDGPGAKLKTPRKLIVIDMVPERLKLAARMAPIS